MRTFSELCNIKSFEERLEYLRLNSSIGIATFGFDRYLNQIFYSSPEWKRVRNQVIVRDTYNGVVCDLSHPDIPISGNVFVHHLNPISKEDVVNRVEDIFNLDYLVCVSHQTHNAIHYGTRRQVPPVVTERTLYDTCPWRKA